MTSNDREMRPFDQSLPMALLRGREATMARFRPILTEYELTEQQWRTLRALSAARSPLDVGQLAETTFLLGPSLSRILSHLDKRDLVERTTDVADQRRNLIQLTAKGRKLVQKIAPKSEREYHEIERLLGTTRLNELLTLLNDLESTSPNEQAAAEELAS